MAGSPLGITRQHTIWCATCTLCDQYDTDTKQQTIAAAFERGWEKTSRGWQCRACVKRAARTDAGSKQP